MIHLAFFLFGPGLIHAQEPPAQYSPIRPASIRTVREECERTVVVKLCEGLAARAEDGQLFVAGAAAQPLAAALDGLAVRHHLLGGERQARAHAALRSRALARGEGPPPPDLALYFEVRAESAAEAAGLAARLADLPSVETAYVSPAPAPPPADLLPTTPSYAPGQTYFGRTEDGTAVHTHHGVLGAAGAGVRIIDCEYSWTLDHEDLALTPQAYVGGTPEGWFPDHGTAVAGILYGGANAYGVTGAAPDAELRLSTQYSLEWGYSSSRAILEAALEARPGDVVLVEMQTEGPSGEFLPEEWTPASFDAIRLATLAGVYVVAAAGNGAADLNDAAYAGAFDLALRDSGAILVGAGTSDGSRRKTVFTNHGDRVDCQAWGERVLTTGFGDLFDPGDARQTYTTSFSGTSSAAAIVAGTVASAVGALRAHGITPPDPAEMRAALRELGAPQDAADALTGRIGPMPRVEELWLRFDLPDGLRHRPTASPGSAVRFLLSGAPGADWRLFRALDTTLEPTPAGPRVLGSRKLTSFAQGRLGPAGTASLSLLVPASPALVGRRIHLQARFEEGGVLRLSNGGVLQITE